MKLTSTGPATTTPTTARAPAPTTPAAPPTTTTTTAKAKATAKPADDFVAQRVPVQQPSMATATTGGRGVGGTLSLLRPAVATIGTAAFVPMSTLIERAKTGAPVPQGLLILDTNLGDVEKTAHASWQQATLDHHGPVHGKDKGRGDNSTSQLVDRFDAALRADVVAAKQQPAFVSASVVVEKAAKQHGLTATTAQKEQAAAALLALNLTSISADNVGDGLSWPVWMAANQARVLLDPALRDTIREATVHEDFGVFGGNYLKGVDDVSALPAPIKLQSALFLAYDTALARANVRGSDRVAPDKAEAVAKDVGAAIDALLKDPVLVDKRSGDFFAMVGLALSTVEEHSLVKDASIGDGRGGYAMPVFDTSKLPKELGIFASWAVPPLFGDHSLQMTSSPGADNRRTLILAVPDGRTLPSGKSLLTVLDRLNTLEQERTPAGQQPSSWFGRDVVVLPSQPGSVLTPSDVRSVVEGAGLLSPR